MVSYRWSEVKLKSARGRGITNDKGRQCHTMTALPKEKIFMYGGFKKTATKDQKKVYNEGYLIDMKSGSPTIAKVTIEPEDGIEENRVPPLYGHTAVYLPPYNMVVIFGGKMQHGSNHIATDSIYAVNVETWASRMIDADGDSFPGERAYHCAAVTRGGRSMLVGFGSVVEPDCTKVTSDLWELRFTGRDISEATWKQVRSGVSDPDVRRSDACMHIIPKRDEQGQKIEYLVVYGGIGPSRKVLSDMYMIPLEGVESNENWWTLIDASSNDSTTIPGGRRWFASGVVDETKMVVFGGMTANDEGKSLLDSLVEFDMETFSWSKVTTRNKTIAPDARTALWAPVIRQSGMSFLIFSGMCFDGFPVDSWLLHCGVTAEAQAVGRGLDDVAQDTQVDLGWATTSKRSRNPEPETRVVRQRPPAGTSAAHAVSRQASRQHTGPQNSLLIDLHLTPNSAPPVNNSLDPLYSNSHDNPIDTLKALKKENHDLRLKTEGWMSSMNRFFKGEMERLGDKVAWLLGYAEELKTTNRIQSANLERLTVENADLRRSEREKDSKLAEARETRTRFQAAASDKDLSVENLQRNLKEANARAADLETRLRDREDTWKNVNSQLAAKTIELQQLKEDQHRTATISDETSKRLRRDILRLEQQVKEGSERVLVLDSQLSSEVGHRQALEKEATEWRQAQLKIHQERHKHADDMRSLTLEKISLEGELTTLKRDMDEKDKQLKRSADALTIHRERMKTVEANLAAVEAKLHQSEEAEFKLREEVTRLQDTVFKQTASMQYCEKAAQDIERMAQAIMNHGERTSQG